MNAAGSDGSCLRWFEYAFALLPFALAFTGAIGLAIGPAACALNLVIMRSRQRLAIKVVAAVSIAIVALFLWAFAAVMLHYRSPSFRSGAR
ncbi:MAG TPA: hypothetical protein VK550_10345 [Polyangiaceae bacterium]|nr:hypothetical protein [Polyangiaceae bacterium]